MAIGTLGQAIGIKFLWVIMAAALATIAAPFKSLNESKAKTQAEMKALIPYVGKWIGESHSEVNGGKVSSMVCTYKTDFMMDSVYLVVHRSCKAKDNSEEVESKWAYTFDAIKGKFRLWGFGPTGIVLEYEGKLTGNRMVWNMLPGQYKFRGDMLEEISGDSLKTAEQNYTPAGKLLEKSSGIFRKLK